MNVFEYLSVFVSIVVGLGVANVLIGTARIISGPPERISVAHLAWVGMVLLMLIFFWWFNFQWDQQEVWSFGLFLWVVGYAMGVFMVSALVIPEDDPDKPDWGAIFFERRRPFLYAWAVMAVTDVVDNVVRGTPMSAELMFDSLPQLLSAVLAIALARTVSRRLFGALTAVHSVLIAANVVLSAGDLA